MVKKATEVTDYLLKVMTPLFVAICSFILYTAATELRELRKEIESVRTEYIAQLTQIEIKIAKLQSQFDYHERVEQ